MLEYIKNGEPWNGEPINEVQHPRAIEFAWSADELGAIGLRTRVQPEPEPSTDPRDYPLLPWKFKTMVRVLGKGNAIMSAIDSIPDMWQREISRGRYLDATMYEFGDPLLQQMRAAVGMTEQELADAWMVAKDLTSA